MTDLWSDIVTDTDATLHELINIEHPHPLTRLKKADNIRGQIDHHPSTKLPD